MEIRGDPSLEVWNTDRYFLKIAYDQSIKITLFRRKNNKDVEEIWIFTS